MRVLLPSALLLALAPGLGVGCSQDAAGPGQPDGGAGPTAGGTFALTGCGYSVTTRDGASAPVPGAAVLGPDPTPFAVHLGVAGDPRTSINVVWRTADETTLATRVLFGAGDALDQNVDGVTFYYEAPPHGPVRIHEAHLCGLKAGTQYSYRVGGKGADSREKWSPTYKFHTAPDLARDPAAQVLLAVLGDTRGGYAEWGQALARADRLGPPDLILFSGDAVTLGTMQSEWDEFFKQAEPVLTRVPLVGAHGNHEINTINYYSQFAFPGNEEFFGLSYGAAHVTVVNDNPADPADLGGRERDFLDSDLKASAVPWRLVMHHMPLWSAGTTHGGDKKLLGLWGPVIDANKVDLVLNGHEHSYERTRPMRGQTPAPGPADGTIFLIPGSAGAVLYDIGKGFWTEKSEKTRSLVLLKVRPGSVAVRAYRDDGTDLDSFNLTK